MFSSPTKGYKAYELLIEKYGSPDKILLKPDPRMKGGWDADGEIVPAVTEGIYKWDGKEQFLYYTREKIIYINTSNLNEHCLLIQAKAAENKKANKNKIKKLF